LNRFLYTAAGGDWFWVDRLGWSYDEWMAWLDRPEVETWVLHSCGTPAGYFELEMQLGSSVEVAYLGLLPPFVGKGLGVGLLSAAVGRAWELGAARVWLHTCTLDHPRALEMYQERGFRVFKEEHVCQDLPDDTPGPWPNSGRRRE